MEPGWEWCEETHSESETDKLKDGWKLVAGAVLPEPWPFDDGLKGSITSTTTTKKRKGRPGSSKIKKRQKKKKQLRNQLEEIQKRYKNLQDERDKIADKLKAAEEMVEQVLSDVNVDKKEPDLDDCFNCLICMEPWTQSKSEEHNICSLACGHFFGRSCIIKWIKHHGDGPSSKCPTCQKEAKLADIRNHYVQQIPC